MDPKSGKSLRLFVNPFSILTSYALKSGEAMLASAEAAVARPTVKVAVLPNAVAPPRKAAAAPRKALRTKARRAKVGSKAKRRRTKR